MFLLKTLKLYDKIIISLLYGYIDKHRLRIFQAVNKKV